MAITLEMLRSDELGPDATVYVDVADYSDTVLTLKQDMNWVSLDRDQQRAFSEFLKKRVEL